MFINCSIKQKLKDSGSNTKTRSQDIKMQLEKPIGPHGGNSVRISKKLQKAFQNKLSSLKKTDGKNIEITAFGL